MMNENNNFMLKNVNFGGLTHPKGVWMGMINKIQFKRKKKNKVGFISQQCYGTLSKFDEYNIKKFVIYYPMLLLKAVYYYYYYYYE